MQCVRGSLSEWQAMGVLNYEMESATLLTMCASSGLRAGSVAGVIVTRDDEEIPSRQRVERGESVAIDVVIEGARTLLA